MNLPIFMAVAWTHGGIDPRSVEAGLFWIPLVPMLAALFNAFFGGRIGKSNVAFIACGAVAVSFLFSVLNFICVYLPIDGSPPEAVYNGMVLHQSVYTWFASA